MNLRPEIGLTFDEVLLVPKRSSNSNFMTPRAQLVVAPAKQPLDAARITLHDHRIEKLPLVDDEDRVMGLITAQDIVKLQEHPHATKDSKGQLRVGLQLACACPI